MAVGELNKADHKKRRHVLFLCTDNSARSQMAEALRRKYAVIGLSHQTAVVGVQ